MDRSSRQAPAAARPVASTSSAQLTPPPTLLSDLAALRDPTRVSDELWSDATESSLVWLLKIGSGATSNVTPVDISGKGKARANIDDDGVALDEDLVHWYCGARGARDCWEPAVFCTRLLGMKRVGEVAVWRERYERYVASLFSQYVAIELSLRSVGERALSKDP